MRLGVYWALSLHFPDSFARAAGSPVWNSTRFRYSSDGSGEVTGMRADLLGLVSHGDYNDTSILLMQPYIVHEVAQWRVTPSQRNQSGCLP